MTRLAEPGRAARAPSSGLGPHGQRRLAMIDALYGRQAHGGRAVREQEGRWLLVERERFDGLHYLSRHDSVEAAGEYVASANTYAQWDVVGLVNLETGERWVADDEPHFRPHRRSTSTRTATPTAGLLTPLGVEYLDGAIGKLTVLRDGRLVGGGGPGSRPTQDQVRTQLRSARELLAAVEGWVLSE